MSHTQKTSHSDRLGAPIAAERHIAGPHSEDDADATDARRRRWYRLRPVPRRRTDLMGFSSTLWMAVGWAVVILVVAYPFPWWW